MSFFFGKASQILRLCATFYRLVEEAVGQECLHAHAGKFDGYDTEEDFENFECTAHITEQVHQIISGPFSRLNVCVYVKVNGEEFVLGRVVFPTS